MSMARTSLTTIMRSVVRLIARALLSAVALPAVADPAAHLSSSHRVELTLFGMKAMGLPVSAKDLKNIPSPKDTEKMAATGLNLNGHLCASIVSIRPLRVPGGFEVTCVAYRGGNARKSYVVDARAGKADEL